jgi:hypothetical protein
MRPLIHDIVASYRGPAHGLCPDPLRPSYVRQIPLSPASERMWCDQCGAIAGAAGDAADAGMSITSAKVTAGGWQPRVP